MKKINTNIKLYCLLNIYRKRLNLKQEDLAKLINISTKYLSEIENCKKYPPIDLAYKISLILNKKIDDIWILQLDLFTNHRV